MEKWQARSFNFLVLGVRLEEFSTPAIVAENKIIINISWNIIYSLIWQILKMSAYLILNTGYLFTIYEDLISITRVSANYIKYFIKCNQIYTMYLLISYRKDDGVLRKMNSEKVKVIVFRFMVFSATFNNISVISWLSVLLVEETIVPGENYRPVANHWQISSHNGLEFIIELQSNLP